LDQAAVSEQPFPLGARPPAGAGGLAERLRARVRALRPALTELLCELVTIDSTNPNFAGVDRKAVVGGETRCNEVLRERLAGAELETTWVAPDPERRNLVAVRRGAGGGRSLVLNGHVDTVAADAASWTGGDPWRPVVADGMVRGLGACDMKGGLVAIWGALEALHEERVRLRGDVLVHSVVGEETMEHELGTTACLQAGGRADAAIVCEPTSARRRLAVTPTSGGYWSLRISVEGRTTHCANRPEVVRAGGGGDAVGVNALEKGVRIVCALQELEQEWGLTKRHPYCRPGAFTIMPGRFHADSPVEGPAPVYFPDRGTIEYSIVYPPSEQPEQPCAEIEAFVLDACRLDAWLREHPPRFEWLVNWPALDTPWHEPIVEALVAARAEVTGERQPTPSPADPVGFAPQDAVWYAQAGVPAVCFGPGDLRVAHAADEHVSLDEVEEAAAAIALCAAAWCGTAAGE
jgi:acetylornithine deacetylase/succinyl-diaminopimelate desuccinylase-like protein